MAHEGSLKTRKQKLSIDLTTNPSKTPKGEKITNISLRRAHDKLSRPTPYGSIPSGWPHSDSGLIVPAG